MDQTTNGQVSIQMERGNWNTISIALNKFASSNNDNSLLQWSEEINQVIQQHLEQSPSTQVSVVLNEHDWGKVQSILQEAYQNSNVDWQQWAKNTANYIQHCVQESKSPAPAAPMPASIPTTSSAAAVNIPRAANEMTKLEISEQMIRQNNNDPDAYLARGVAYGLEGNNQAALDDFNRVVQMTPNKPEGYWYRGIALIEQGKHQDAIFDLNYAIKLLPQEGELYYFRGLAYFEGPEGVKDNRQALMNFDKAMQLNYKDPGLYVKRAALFEEQGDINRAVKNMEQAIAHTTDPYVKTQYEDAIRQIREGRSQARQQVAKAKAKGCLGGLISGIFDAFRMIIREIFRP